jgi:hypothetical protein
MEQIEFEPLTSQPPATASPRQTRLGGLAVGVAVVATLAVGLAVVARTDRTAPTAPQPVATRAASILSEPSAEAAPMIAPRPTHFEAAYSSCISHAGGSPDAREHWVDSCRREAARILHDDRIYAACMSEAGGSADSLERHAADCRGRIGSEEPCRVSCTHSYFHTTDTRSSSRRASS